MKTDYTTANRWFEMLVEQNLEHTPGNLMKVMLPDVMDILAEYGHKNETRINRRARFVMMEIRIRSGLITKFGERNRLFRQEDTLRQFLAVWQVITMLEGDQV